MGHTISGYGIGQGPGHMILLNDPVFGHIREIEDVPADLVGRLSHYFSTYKLRPDPGGTVEVGEPYGRAHAESVVSAALEDYAERYRGTATD